MINHYGKPVHGPYFTKEMAEVNMATVREDIVVSNTFTTEKELKPYIDLAKEYGYNVTTVVVENRNNTDSIHDVPQEIRQRQADRLKNSIKLL